jgi:hypothetical protein
MKTRAVSSELISLENQGSFLKSGKHIGAAGFYNKAYCIILNNIKVRTPLFPIAA